MADSSSLARPGRLAQLVVLFGVTALVLSTGCGNKAKVTLQAQFSSTEPAGNSGDDSGDGWTDNHSTPTGFAMAIQSAKLTGQGVSFTIFDKGADTADALFIRLYNSPTKITIPPDNDHDLGTGTYDTLELKVVFFEAAIEAVDATASHLRRLRTYFQDYREPLATNSQMVTTHDQLISDSDMTVPAETNADPTALGDGGRDLRWINPDNGKRCSARTDCDDSGNPYQVDMTPFPNGYPTVTISIPDIVVEADTDANFIVTLTAKIQNLFFYDSDGNDGDTTHFDYLRDILVAPASKDGKIKAACTDAPTCTSGPDGTADFGIGPPNFSVEVASQ
jgi:hypothetical protein